MELPSLYEDEDLLVVDKPSGLPVHRGASREPVTVVDVMRARGASDVHLVHRLDRATSGALVIARNAAAARALGADFQEGRVLKEYLAFVRGEAPLFVVVDHPVPKDEGKERAPACTDVRCLLTVVLEESPLRERRYSLVWARPRTGRFHQIRRHLKHLGHPLVGDTTYGRSEHNRLLSERFGLTRLALHAYRITLLKPSTGAPITVTAPLPADLAAPLSRLGVDVGALPALTAGLLPSSP